MTDLSVQARIILGALVLIGIFVTGSPIGFFGLAAKPIGELPPIYWLSQAAQLSLAGVFVALIAYGGNSRSKTPLPARLIIPVSIGIFQLGLAIITFSPQGWTGDTLNWVLSGSCYIAVSCALWMFVRLKHPVR